MTGFVAVRSLRQASRAIKRMGRAGRRYVLENLSIETHTQQLLGLFESVLCESPRLSQCSPAGIRRKLLTGSEPS